MPENLPFDSDDFEEPPAFFPKDIGRGSGGLGSPVRVKVEGVYSTEEMGTIHRYVQLEDDAGRVLPMSIGPFEALAIHMALENSPTQRPLTHDLMRNLLDKLDGRLYRVVIDDLWNQTYYAKLYVHTKSGEVEIDCRPSDAIALALRTDSKIYVMDSILDGGFDDEGADDEEER